jgi:hypothetical protein
MVAMVVVEMWGEVAPLGKFVGDRNGGNDMEYQGVILTPVYLGK